MPSLFESSVLEKQIIPKNLLERLKYLLEKNLDFHGSEKEIAAHNLHSFPAKFPPQLPRFFIEHLTSPGDVVLDPMVGSGTTIVEAYLSGRIGIGLDIDVLALKISRAKTSPIKTSDILKIGMVVYQEAKNDVLRGKDVLQSEIETYFDQDSKNFIDGWFLPQTQLELFALLKHIREVQVSELRNFLEVVFSSTIITKMGGVSLALDLAHTRPHKVKALFDSSGNYIFRSGSFKPEKKHVQSKVFKSALEEFKRKLLQSLEIASSSEKSGKAYLAMANSQQTGLKSNSVDLIITSPPYASNAIDYMRAHKFSLVWFGYGINELKRERAKYIGGETVSGFPFEQLPAIPEQKIGLLSQVDPKRSKVLRRYFSEMKRSLSEMFRVLKPEKSCIMVVGNSTMKGIDTEIPLCLKEIGESVGFVVPKIGERRLDRDRRMLPTSSKRDPNSQIQQRMMKEYVIGFYKPGVHK